MSITELVKRFAESAIKQDEAIVSGDKRGAKKYGNKIVQYWRAIKEFGNDGKEELSKLFRHNHPSARSAAAACLLKYKTAEALEVLEVIAKMPGLVGFEADEAIKRWKEGTWNLE